MMSERNKGRLFATRAALVGLLREIDEVIADEIQECAHRRIQEPETFGDVRKCLDCGESIPDESQKRS
jgi:hypothetical protein